MKIKLIVTLLLGMTLGAVLHAASPVPPAYDGGVTGISINGGPTLKGRINFAISPPLHASTTTNTDGSSTVFVDSTPPQTN